MHEEIFILRKELHQNPELSGEEVLTAHRIKNFIQKHNPTEIIVGVGGNGLMAIYKFPKPGPSIAIRCELDALPIVEENPLEYKSLNRGVSHKCGHDGHMAIVAGLIFWIKKQSFSAGKIVLLFQPAEETGKGAMAVMNDARFKSLKLDYIFALHNIPGESLNSIIAMQNGFSAEVQSFSLSLHGKKSHAAEPEHGINPALCISSIVNALSQYNIPDPIKREFAVLTPVHINMGEKSYGISAGHGELHYTVRTWSEKTMDVLKKKIEELVKEECEVYMLHQEIDWFEHFPASANDIDCNQLVSEVARACGYNIVERPYPFKFGEDFGWFSRSYKTAMFGLGAGLETPALHHTDYDFPDEILGAGIKMFTGLIHQILE